MERWKDIPGYDGAYRVSSLGRVLSVKRGRILAEGTHEHGYKMVALSKNGRLKTFKVHRLVAEAFIDNPDHKREVNHINGNKSDNSVNNLEWTTREGNMKHASTHGLIPGVEVVMLDPETGEALKTFCTISEAERSAKAHNIRRACNTGIKAGGYRWKVKEA